MYSRSLALTALVLMAPPVVAQQTPEDVPTTHWAYPAVQHLIAKGLLQNYPNGRFLGDRPMTRYEIAVLLKRILDSLAQTPVTLERVIEKPVEKPAEAPPKPEVTFTPDEVAELRKLLKEFLPELLVLNTNFKALQEKFEALDTKLVDFGQDIKDLKEFTGALQGQIDVLNRKRLDGYIQARYSRRGTEDPLRAPDGTGTDTTRGNGGDRDTFHVRRARINLRGDVSARSAYRVQLDARTAPSAGAQEMTVKEAYVVVKNFPLSLKPKGALPAWWTADLWLGQSVTPFGHILSFSSSDRSAPERYIAFSDVGPGLFANQDYDKGVALRGKLFNRFEFHMGLYNGNGVVSNDLGRRKDFIGQIGTQVTPTVRLGISSYEGDGSTFGTTVPGDGFIGLVGSETPTVGPGGVLLNKVGNPVVYKTRERGRHLFGVDTQWQLPFKGELKVEYVRGKGGQVGSNQTVVPKEFYAYVDAKSVEGYYVELNKHYGEIITEPGKPGIPRLKIAGGFEYYNRNARPAKTGPFSQINLGTDVAPNVQSVTRQMFEESRLHAGVLYQLDAATRLRLWYEDPLHNPHLPGKPDFQNHTPFWTAEVQVRF